MNIKTILLGVGAVAVVVGSSVGSSMYVATYVVEHTAGATHEEKTESTDDAEHPPIYVELDPFIVNFMQDAALRYLQLTVQVMSRDNTVVESINSHMPEIRNALILLLSGHSYADLVTREGKEAIREQIKSEVNRILAREPGVEDVYLTGFVMQ